MSPGAAAGDALERLRAQRPLVHNITNFVVMNTTANALLAIGASPVMAHAVEEVEEMVGLASALVLNIGTLSTVWAEAMLRAGRAARARGIPIVLDPVGAGATRMRTELAHAVLREARPTVVRANASEIRALALAESHTRGVDSVDSAEASLEAARALAARHGCVVSTSGEVDVVVAPDGVRRVANGHPMMSRVTGMGCTATAITGAFLAIDASPLDAATWAMVACGVAGERAAAASAGPGSFQVAFLDALASLDAPGLAASARVT